MWFYFIWWATLGSHSLQFGCHSFGQNALPLPLPLPPPPYFYRKTVSYITSLLIFFVKLRSYSTKTHFCLELEVFSRKIATNFYFFYLTMRHVSSTLISRLIQHNSCVTSQLKKYFTCKGNVYNGFLKNLIQNN